ncbi:hypothetical protein ACFV23_00485 [Streptomyces sp. NPDC059627]
MSAAVPDGTRTVPALCRGLVVVEATDGMVIEGGPHRMLLSGAAASGFLGALLPLLDGRHEPDELSALLDVEPAAVLQALELLDDWGVLEAGTTAREEAVPEPTVTYYSRTAALTGGHGSAASVLDELSRSHVRLITGAELTRVLTEDLTAAGVGTVSTAGEGGVPHGCDLVVVADEAGEPARLAAQVATGWQDNVPVLRLAAHDGAVEVGPLFWPGESACVDCFRRGGGTGGREGGGQELLAAAAAMEVLAVLARTTPVTTLNALVRTTTAGGRTERRLVAPDPSCPTCGDRGDRARDNGVRLIETYEWHVAAPPPRLMPAPRPLAPLRARRREASRSRVALPTSPAGRLPAEPGTPPPAGPEWLVPLAAILPDVVAATAVDGGDPSSDGSGPVCVHGSVHVYVLTDLAPLGLPGRVFRYDEAGHRLLSVRADAPAWRGALLSSGPPVADLDAVVVVVADTGPLAPEHGDGAWRAAHLGAGIAALRLACAAMERQLPLTFGLGWSEDLPAVLELDPTRESVAAVAGLVAGPRAEEATA